MEDIKNNDTVLNESTEERGAEIEYRGDERPVSPREQTRRYPQQRRGNSSRAQFNPRFKKRVCRFCKGMIKDIDYKNVEMLKRFTSERGKILPRRLTGTCAKHQRLLAKEIKRARILALLPFVADK